MEWNLHGDWSENIVSEKCDDLQGNTASKKSPKIGGWKNKNNLILGRNIKNICMINGQLRNSEHCNKDCKCFARDNEHYPILATGYHVITRSYWEHEEMFFTNMIHFELTTEN